MDLGDTWERHVLPVNNTSSGWKTIAEMMWTPRVSANWRAFNLSINGTHQINVRDAANHLASPGASGGMMNRRVPRKRRNSPMRHPLRG
jgi:hypothetical protein